MSRIRKLIDPYDTLPCVELDVRQTQEWTNLMREKVVVTDGFDQIGFCDLVTETATGSSKVHFDEVEINKEKRGKGFGLATYVLAIELAHSRRLPFETQDYNQTVHAKRIWELLASRGIADVVKPFQPSMEWEGRFIGKFQVPYIDEASASE